MIVLHKAELSLKFRRDNMSKIKIITDTTSYLSKESAMEKDITVVPLKYVFGEESYIEGFKGEFDDFFDKLETTKLFPTTSQPSAGEFYDAYVEAFKKYDEIIVILLSSKISGTYSSAVTAASMLEGKKISIIDSETAVSNLRTLVEDAYYMAQEGYKSEEIINAIEEKKKRMKVYLTTGTLEYLRRGGRLSNVQSTLGNLLNIKPILELKNGEIDLLEKIRGNNKVISTLLSKIPDDVKSISICHISNLEEAEKLYNNLLDKYPNAKIGIDEIGPVIGAHLGPKTLGLLFYN